MNRTPEEREEEELCKIIEDEMTLLTNRLKEHIVMAYRHGGMDRKRKQRWDNREEGK